MFEQTLAPSTKRLLSLLQNVGWLKKYYLAGGTALALHYGHRQSIDLDWFKTEHINVTLLLKDISSVGFFEILNQEKDTLEGILEKVKVSFITYPYPLLADTVSFGKIKIAAPIDIAIMKLGAVASRNVKKDFIDLFVFLNQERMTLTALLKKARQKFTGVSYDSYHLFKSLTYFAEADKDAMPKMFIKLDWNQVKTFFIAEVSKIAK